MPDARSERQPLTIYECPECGSICPPTKPIWHWASCVDQPDPRRVRVFRENAIDSDEVIDALIVRVWEDPPEAFGDTEREDLRAALRAAFGLAAEGQDRTVEG